jgi:hypothetical protein
VFRDQHALAKLILEAANLLLQILHGDGIDAGKRLIEQDELGLGAEGPGDLQFAALAAGERVGLLVADFQQAVLIEQILGPLAALGAVDVEGFKNGLEVLPDGKAAKVGAFL